MKIFLEGDEYTPRRGHWVILRRTDQRQHCVCWNAKSKNDDGTVTDKGKYHEPEMRCPICHGEGWIYEDELHLARRRLVSPEIGLASSETMAEIGWMNINYILFYFLYYVEPKKGDKIFEIQLDDNAEPIRPFKMIERYRIAVAEPFRDQNGRVEFYRAAAKLEVV